MWKSKIEKAREDYLKDAKVCEKDSIDKYQSEVRQIQREIENYEFPEDVQKTLNSRYKEIHGKTVFDEKWDTLMINYPNGYEFRAEFDQNKGKWGLFNQDLMKCHRFFNQRLTTINDCRNALEKADKYLDKFIKASDQTRRKYIKAQ